MGIFSSQTARFSSFLKSPLRVWYSLRKIMLKQPDDSSGHSALGGYATIVLLAICIIMAVTGHFQQMIFCMKGLLPILRRLYQAGFNCTSHDRKCTIGSDCFASSCAVNLFLAAEKNLVPAMITGSRPKAVGPSGAITMPTFFGLVAVAADWFVPTRAITETKPF